MKKFQIPQFPQKIPTRQHLKQKNGSQRTLSGQAIRFEPAPESAPCCRRENETPRQNHPLLPLARLLALLRAVTILVSALPHTHTHALLSYTKFKTTKSDFVSTLLNSLRKDSFFFKRLRAVSELHQPVLNKKKCFFFHTDRRHE